MTLMENLFQMTGNATNRTLPFRPFAAAGLQCARTGMAYLCYTGCLHAQNARRADSLRHRAGTRTADSRDGGGNWGKPPGSSVRFQISDVGIRTCVAPTSSVNVAKASATLSLDMTAEEAAATPFYANFTQQARVMETYPGNTTGAESYE